MKKKNQIYFLTFLFLILIFSFLIFLLLGDIKKKSQELSSKRQKFVFLNERLENIERLKKTKKEIEPFLKELENIFVDSEAPINFFNFLEEISKECEVNFLKISPVPKKEEKALYLQITLVSSFPKISCFLEKLEAGRYLIELSNLNFSKLTESELKTKDFSGFSQNDLKATFVFKVSTK